MALLHWLRAVLFDGGGALPFLVGFVVTGVRYSLLTVGATFTFLVCYVLLRFYRATLHRAIRWIAGLGFGGVFGRGAVHPFRRLYAFDAQLINWLNAGQAWSERAIVYSLNQLTDNLAILIGVPVAIALVVAELAQIVGAKLKRAVTRPEVQRITNTVVKPVKTTVRVVVRQTKIVERRVVVVKTQAVHAGKAAAHALVAPVPRLKTVERTVTAQGTRLKTVERKIRMPAAIALVLAVLARIGASYITCRNNKRVGREVCNMDRDLLTSLLLDLAVLGIALNIRDFTKAMQAIVTPVAGVVTDMVTGPETEA